AETLDAPHSSLLFFGESAEGTHPELTVALSEADGPAAWPWPDLAQQAARARRSLLLQLPPAAPGGPPRAALCALLRVERRLLGALCLARAAEQPPLGEAELRRADALALAASPRLL